MEIIEVMRVYRGNGNHYKNITSYLYMYVWIATAMMNRNIYCTCMLLSKLILIPSHVLVHVCKCTCTCIMYVHPQIEEFGKTESKDLKPGGHSIPVTEANKREYVQLACQMKMTGSIRPQIKSFLEGFYEVIPKELISIFNEQELELLISGLPTIDIDDLKANTEYHKYTEGSLQVGDFWGLGGGGGGGVCGRRKGRKV